MGQSISSVEKSQIAHEMHRTNASLISWFDQVYNWHIQQFPKSKDALVVELGSGGSDLKKYHPSVKTTDILKLPHVDMIVDAHKMPFENNSVDALTMVNVLHHLHSPLDFFKEAQRVLKPGGKIILTEPYVSLVSFPIYTWIHHEPCQLNKNIWKLPPGDPLLMSNQAIPTKILFNEWSKIKTSCPRLEKVKVWRHSSLSYFLTGGVSRKGFLPTPLWRLINKVDQVLCKFFGKAISSFISVTISKS
jgi:SAM-dependent methyltransferase